MADKMLTELYRLSFATKREVETPGLDDRNRAIAIAKNALLSKLIDIRTEQIKSGE